MDKSDSAQINLKVLILRKLRTSARNNLAKSLSQSSHPFVDY